MRTLFETLTSPTYLPFTFAFLLLLILIVSFRARAVVFCQYLKKMTGIQLSPAEVKQVYAQKGAEGVRDLFLDLIIREDLKTGGVMSIPQSAPTSGPEAGTGT
jgi:hypothetical protein